MSNSFENLLTVAITERVNQFSKQTRMGSKPLRLKTEVERDGENILVNFIGIMGGVEEGPPERSTLVLPRAHRDKYNNLVIGGEVPRAVCPMMLVVNEKAHHISYEQMIMFLLLGNLENHYPEQGKRSNLVKILRGFQTGRGRMLTKFCQRFLNTELFNLFPICREPLQDWAMNHRVMIFDPKFGGLRPEEKLRYQIEKNRRMFPWGSTGISDGAANKNYILQKDLRDITPFGNFHNPQRNLYSTLGMKGDERPAVVSTKALELENQGISRGGWNWMTAFLDLPLNFEDQILVDIRHAGKEVSYKRNFTIFGRATVNVGETVQKGRALGIQGNQAPCTMDLDCDRAVVEGVRECQVPFDGIEHTAIVVTLKVFYTIKEGVKITNAHGNKGIIRLFNLGHMVDPVRGNIPLDVMVSARSIQKRKNYGQILEALTTLVNGKEERIVVSSKYTANLEAISKSLVSNGYDKDGVCQAVTPWGNFNTVCGWVHWGVIKTPEEQLWSKEDTWRKDGQGIRQRGNKISPVEFRAMITQFGVGSKVVDEILTYQQGTDSVREGLRTVAASLGNKIAELPVVDPSQFVYLPTGMGTFHNPVALNGTVADKRMYPKGCYLKLPLKLRIIMPNNPTEEVYEGVAIPSAYGMEGVVENARVFETDILHVPNISMRETWLHPTGLYGLSEMASSLNLLLEDIDRFKNETLKEGELARSIFRYVKVVSTGLATKVGKITRYLTSVRYPYSSKATASLSTDLPKDWVEIHMDMARALNVTDGSYVLAERFPCLGFMSVRVQRVRVTQDPQCKNVIRASGNSLVSQNLDFDGDVLYLMSFHTDASKEELKNAFHNPHPKVAEELERLCSRKKPITETTSLSKVKLRAFGTMTPDAHAEMNGKSLAVKLHTGPVIALVYNLQRIVEGAIPYTERELHIAIESLMDKVGNSVFSQKHGERSLREECIEALCLADEAALCKLGMQPAEAQRLCDVLLEKAKKLGVRNRADLAKHYESHIKEGRSSIINAIVRREHPIYFATRSNLHPVHLLDKLVQDANDIPSYLVKRHLLAIS